jgi:hypothetical protein
MAWSIFEFQTAPPKSRTYRRVQGKNVLLRADEEVLSALDATIRATGNEVGGLLIGELEEGVQIDDARTLPIEHSEAWFELSWKDIQQFRREISGKHRSLVGHFRCPRKEVAEPKAEDHIVADMLGVGAPVLLLIPGSGEDARLYRRVRRTWVEELRFPLVRQPNVAPAPVEAPLHAENPVLQPLPAASSVEAQFNWRPWLPLALIALLAAAAVTGFLAFRRHSAHQVASTIPPLGLAVELREPGLLVKWNPANPDVLHGTSGMLSIQAGAQRLQIPLDRQALREGNVFYVPVSPQAEFRLEIYHDATHYTGETISATTGLHASVPVAPPSRQPTPVPLPAAQKVSIERPRYTPANARPPTSRRRVVRSFEPPRTITAPSQEPRTAAEPALPAPPQIAASTQVRLPDLPALHPEYSARPSVPASYVAAVPVRQVNPTIPPGLHLMTTEQFSITVRVEIDSGGRVVSADPVDVKTPAQRLVAPEAAQAARLWRFEPARRNEQPVPSEALLKFDIERPH